MKYARFQQLDWQPRFSYLKSIVFHENELDQTGTKFQIIRLLPDTKIEPHFHKKVYEIFYVLRGNGSFIFNNAPFKGAAGDIFLCEPHDVHAIENNSNHEELIFLVFKTNEASSDIHWV